MPDLLAGITSRATAFDAARKVTDNLISDARSYARNYGKTCQR